MPKMSRPKMVKMAVVTITLVSSSSLTTRPRAALAFAATVAASAAQVWLSILFSSAVAGMPEVERAVAAGRVAHVRRELLPRRRADLPAAPRRDAVEHQRAGP